MRHIILVLTLVISACSSITKVTTSPDISSIMNLIALTEEKSPDGIKGTFHLSIKASGIQGSTIYLNTEIDYRDRRNITVSLDPKLIVKYTKKYGDPSDLYFINKTIKVTGEAKRVKIYFFSRGKITKKYYFQTHINVTSLNQIEILS